MAVITAMCVVPLCFLGMTYDARTSKPGVDIFPPEYVNDPVVTDFRQTKTNYIVVSSESQLEDLLEISGDLSLKIKTGMVTVEGKGSFLKNRRQKTDKVEIVTSLEYTASVVSFKADAKPRENWVDLHSVGVLGTHFVSRITKKAEMIAYLRFEVFNSSDLQEVKGAVNGALGTGGGIEIAAKGKLEDLQKQVEDKASLSISYYGTVPLKSIPNDVEGFRQLVTTFKEQVDEAGLSDGIPLTADLTPLEDIADEEHRDQFKFLKNKNLEDALEDFERMLDELRETRLSLGGWAKSLPYHLDEKFEKEIGQLLKNITKVTEVFYDVTWKLNLSEGPEQLQPALDAYDYDGNSVYNRYHKAATRLIQRIDPLVKKDDVTADTYVQWGNNNCTAPSTEVLYDGFAISSTEEGIGGMAQYECVPKSPQKGYDLTNDASRQSHLAGIRYTKLDNAVNPFKGSNAKKISEKGVTCAKCYSPDSESVVMFPAVLACPLTWEMMYTGYLMASRVGGHTTQYVCVDDTPAAGYQMDTQASSRDTMALTVVHPSGSLPSETYVKDAWIRCVVCSMKSNQVSL